MKFSTILLSSLSLLSTSVFAAPAAVDSDIIAARKVNSPLRDWLLELTSEVKGHADSMQSTVNALPANASKKQKKVAAASVIKDIKAMTSEIHAMNNKLVAAKKVCADCDSTALETRQDAGKIPKDVLGQLNGKPIVFAKLLNALLKDLDPAIQSVLVTLNLGEVNAALQPLLKVELPGLLTNVGNLVNGLLVALAPLLVALGGILGPLLLGLGL